MMNLEVTEDTLPRPAGKVGDHGTFGQKFKLVLQAVVVPAFFYFCMEGSWQGIEETNCTYKGAEGTKASNVSMKSQQGCSCI